MSEKPRWPPKRVTCDNCGLVIGWAYTATKANDIAEAHAPKCSGGTKEIDSETVAKAQRAKKTAR